MTPEAKLDLEWSTFLKNAFTLALRVAFEDDFTPVEYRYAKVGTRESQISIDKESPVRTSKYPNVIVSTEEAEISIDKLGPEEIIEETNDLVTYGGNGVIPVRVDIEAETPQDRDRITDIIGIYVRTVFRPLLAKYNVAYLGIRGGNDGDEDRVSASMGKIFKGHVTTICFISYTLPIDQSFRDKILSIDLSRLKAGTSNSDMTPIFTEP